MRPRLVIGLTGGIASGKTVVSRYFEQLGVPVIDADLIAREFVEPGEPGLDLVVEQFGTGVLDEEGNLDRRRLRSLVFKDEDDRRRLESILHPLIREWMQDRLSGLDSDYAILVIPLLFEAKQTDMVDRVLVVDAPESEQVERAGKRDGVSKEDVRQIISTQASRATRLAQATDVIDNSGTIEDLREKVRRMDEFYRSLVRGLADEGH
ncbi:MAG: dephospho-CoA kinase [Gammaproteobacteria bacterium]|nr:dephospho-CoA kinase [Gammaproteobacteria bacterium]